jgi:hypothetical protein
MSGCGKRHIARAVRTHWRVNFCGVLPRNPGEPAGCFARSFLDVPLFCHNHCRHWPTSSLFERCFFERESRSAANPGHARHFRALQPQTGQLQRLDRRVPPTETTDGTIVSVKFSDASQDSCWLSSRCSVSVRLCLDQRNRLAPFSKPVEIIRPRLHHQHTFGPKFRVVGVSSTDSIRFLVSKLTLYRVRPPATHLI